MRDYIKEARIKDKFAEIITRGKTLEMKTPTMSAEIHGLELQHYETAERVNVLDFLHVMNYQGLPSKTAIIYVDEERDRLVLASSEKADHIAFPIRKDDDGNYYLTPEEVDEAVVFVQERKAHTDKILYTGDNTPLIVLD